MVLGAAMAALASIVTWLDLTKPGLSRFSAHLPLSRQTVLFIYAVGATQVPETTTMRLGLKQLVRGGGSVAVARVRLN